MNRAMRRQITTKPDVSVDLKALFDKERENVMNSVVDNFSIAVASTLSSKFDIHSDNLIDVMKAIMYTFQSLEQNRVNFTDLNQALLEEEGVSIKPVTDLLRRK